MEVRNKRKDIILTIESKRGEPLVNRRGFVNIIKGNYFLCDKISMDILNDHFVWEGKDD